MLQVQLFCYFVLILVYADTGSQLPARKYMQLCTFSETSFTIHGVS